MCSNYNNRNICGGRNAIVGRNNCSSCDGGCDNYNVNSCDNVCNNNCSGTHNNVCGCDDNNIGNVGCSNCGNNGCSNNNCGCGGGNILSSAACGFASTVFRIVRGLDRSLGTCGCGNNNGCGHYNNSGNYNGCGTNNGCGCGC